jgi:PST family polysaccharide transporter
MNLREQSIQGGVWAGIGAAGSSFISFVSFLLLSRFLGPEAFGLMAMVEATLALASRVMSSGLSEPLVQFQNLDAEHSDTLFWTLQAASLSLVAAMIALGSTLGRFFVQEELPALIVIASIALYIESCGLVPSALLMRSFRFFDSTQATILSESIGGVVAVLLALAGYGVWSLVFQRLVAAAVNSTLIWHKAGWRPGCAGRPNVFSELWRFSGSRGLEAFWVLSINRFPESSLVESLVRRSLATLSSRAASSKIASRS